MAFNVKDNPKIYEEEEVDESYNLIPKLDPSNYRVFEIMEDGTDVNIQDEEGSITRNHFNILMKTIMDDYYSCLNFYGE